MEIRHSEQIDILKRLQRLQEQIKKHPCTAMQGLDLPTPAEGQLHLLKNDCRLPEMFLLVTATNQEECSIIPGSFDAMEGGPNDIVLPQNVFGDYVILFLDLASKLPTMAIGKGFARLDESTYRRILNSLDSFQGKEGQGATFQYALPYIGESDERIAYHNQIRQELLQARIQTLIQAGMRGIIMWRKNTSSLKVAASTVQEDIRHVFQVKGKEEKVQLAYSVPERKIFVNVFGKDGDYSQKMDGCQLCGVDGTSFGILKDGQLSFDYPPDTPLCQLFFATEEGMLLDVEPAE